jgi:stage II sporulation protein M
MRYKKKSSKKSSFIYENFKSSLSFLKEIKTFILLSLILFIISAIFGYIFPTLFQKEIAQLISDLVNQTQGLTSLELIKFIFLNNLKSSFFAVFFGFIFGIIPLVIAIFNGYVLGFVANKAVSVEGISVLLRLLPHGIFEIPAILISVASGLKLGIFIFKRHKDMKNEFLENVLNSIRVFIFIVVPLLILAAIIEGILIIVIK